MDNNDDQIDLVLSLDTTTAREQLRKLRSGINKTVETLGIRAEVNSDAAKDELRKLQREIARTELAIRLRSESGAAKRDIADLQNRLGELKLQARTIDLHTDAGQAKREIQSLKNEINSLNNAAANVRVGGIFGNQRLAGAFNAGALAGAGGGFAAGMLGGGLGARAGGGAGGFIGGAVGTIAGGPIAGAVGGVAGSAVGAIGGAALDVTAGMVAGGLQSLSQLQQYETAIRSLIKDQSQANELFNELKQMRIDLPTVDMQTMASAMQKLVGAGRDAKGVDEDVRSILDAAALSTVGVSEGTERITRAIAQMKTNGRLLGEELNQISEVGIPASQILIKQFGMGIDEIKKASQSGQIAIDDIINSLLQGLRDEYSGALANQAETLGGRLAELRNKFTLLQEKVAEPMIDPLIEALDRLMTAADSGTLDQLAGAMKMVTNAGVGFLELVGQLADAFGANKKLNTLSTELSSEINDGKLKGETKANAQAVQFAANALMGNRRKDENALLTKQQVADFYAARSGEYVDPNSITAAQVQAVTSEIDNIANATQFASDTNTLGMWSTGEFAANYAAKNSQGNLDAAAPGGVMSRLAGGSGTPQEMELAVVQASLTGLTGEAAKRVNQGMQQEFKSPTDLATAMIPQLNSVAADKSLDLESRGQATSNSNSLLGFLMERETGLTTDELQSIADQFKQSGNTQAADAINREIERRNKQMASDESDANKRTRSNERDRNQAESEAKAKREQMTLDERAALVGLPAGSEEKEITQAESGLMKRAEAMGLRPDATIDAVQQAERESLRKRGESVGVDLQASQSSKPLSERAKDAGVKVNIEPEPITDEDRKRRAVAIGLPGDATSQQVTEAEAIAAEKLVKRAELGLPENATPQQIADAELAAQEKRVRAAENAKLAERARMVGLPEQSSEEVVQRAENAMSLGLPTTATDDEIRNAERERQKEREQATKEQENADKFKDAVPVVNQALTDFANSIKDPEMRAAFEAGKFELTQNEQGGLAIDSTLAQLATRSRTERSDLAGLNSLIQSKVDDQAMLDEQRRRTKMQEDWRDKEIELLNKINVNVSKSNSAVVGPNQ